MNTTKTIKFPEIGVAEARVLEDGLHEVGLEFENKAESLEEIFRLVEASKLSLTDKFMKYSPNTPRVNEFKSILTAVIQRGVKDFYHPKYDPSFSYMGKNIEYVAGRRPAVGRSYLWWYETARTFCRERGSRLGSWEEYVAFMGVIIKSLVEGGWDPYAAWLAVCEDSKDLAHYKNSKYSIRDFEMTGSREICGWFDLGNTCKIISSTQGVVGNCLVVGASFGNTSKGFPLAAQGQYAPRSNPFYLSVGWIVCTK